MARLVEIVQGEGSSSPATAKATPEEPTEETPEETTTAQPEEESSPAENAKE
jgi:hypothetical protein